MKHIKKTNCASVKITSEDSVILSLKSANQSSCLYFENIGQFENAIRKRHIRVKKWIVSVPDNLCITKSIELPAADIGQAYKMLEFELASYLPLPAEELVYGCLAISKNDNILKILVYILKTKILDDILTKFRTIGIKPSMIMVDSAAVQSWFNQDKKNNAVEMDLLYGKKFIFASVVKNGGLIRYEEIVLQDSNLESQREKIIGEINYLATETATDKHQIALRIAARTSIQPEIKSWFEGNYNNVEFLELPQLNAYAKDSTSIENELSFESVITQGLARAAEDPDFIFLNLLPEKSLKRTKQKQLITNVAVALLLGVFLVVCLWLNFSVMNWRIQHACQKITNEIAPIEQIAADIENKHQQVKAIQTQMSNRRQISRIFSELYKYSPKEISISQVSYVTKANTAFVNINGQADTLSVAFEYSNAMKDSELLNNIQIINAQQIPRPGGSVVEFKAECSVNGNQGL